MAVFSNNLTIHTGTDFEQTFVLEDGNTNSSLNLTGYTVAGQMRKTYTSTTATNFTGQVQSATGGTVRISLSATQTNALKAGRYVYDTEITKTATGEVTRVIEGQVDVTPSVTRAS